MTHLSSTALKKYVVEISVACLHPKTERCNHLTTLTLRHTIYYPTKWKSTTIPLNSVDFLISEILWYNICSGKLISLGFYKFHIYKTISAFSCSFRKKKIRTSKYSSTILILTHLSRSLPAYCNVNKLRNACGSLTRV